MQNSIAVITSGLIATGAMTVLLYLVHWSKLTHGDMIRAVGSFFSGKMSNAFAVGLTLHIIAGICFAFLYNKFFEIFGVSTLDGFLLAGGLIGFGHGFVVSFSIIVIVAEHHPIESLRRFGFPVAILYIIGHVVYGLTLGAMLSRHYLLTT